MEDKKTGIIEFNVFHGVRLFINDLHRVFIGNPVVYSIYRLIDHAFRDFRIDLSGRDMLVSEHLAQGEQRNAVHQRDCRSESMPGKVESDVFLDSAGLGNKS